MGNWKKKTFQQIAMQCVAYVAQNFGKNVVIMFGVYPQKSTTKDHAHKSRTQSTGIGSDVQVTVATKLAIKKNAFLSNTRNKQNIINSFSEILVKEGLKTIHAHNDADTLK